MGCDRKISLDLRHRPLISPSDSWTFLPGLAPRTVEQLQQLLQTNHHRSRGLTEMGAQWRTAEPRSRHGLPAPYLPRVSKLCCRCSICHCLSLYRRARWVCVVINVVPESVVGVIVVAAAAAVATRCSMWWSVTMSSRRARFRCVRIDGDAASWCGTRVCLAGSRMKLIK